MNTSIFLRAAFLIFIGGFAAITQAAAVYPIDQASILAGSKFDIDKSQGFYLRQLRDMKGGIPIGPGGVSLENFADYSKLFGWALALGHARSGDAAEIAGYCGEEEGFGKAMYSFARSYAKQNEQDFELFRKAVKSGRLVAAKT